MIDFEGDVEPMRAGERRAVLVRGSGFVRIKLRRFRETQPGRGFLSEDDAWQPLPADGQVILHARPEDWRGHRGSLIVIAWDDDMRAGTGIVVLG